MTDRERIALFGLRTNVSYFASHTGFANLSTRLKACALLYDHVLVEEGVYRCTVTDRGAMEFYGPPAGPEDLRPVRTKKGVVAGMRMAKTGSQNFSTVFSGRVEKQLVAQFYTHIDGMPRDTTWIQMGLLPDDADKRAKELASGWTWAERDRVAGALGNGSRWLRDKIHENLNLDLARAALLGAELLPDGLTAPLLRAKLEDPGLRVVGTGERALHFVLPDIREASWADVAELRKWPGFVALRAKLRELDDVALSDAGVHQRIEDEFLAELERRSPRWRSVAIGAGITLLGGVVIPAAAPVAAVVMPVAVAVDALGLAPDAFSTAKEVADQARGRHEWTATLIRARKYLEKQRELKESVNA